MVRHIFLSHLPHRIVALLSLLLGLTVTSTVFAQQTYYGPPYTVQSAVLVGSYQTLGAATAALEAAWAPHCPGCVITAAYFNPATTGDVAAAVILNPNSSSPTRDGIFATERIDDPKRVAGACLVCSAGTGQAMAGQSPTNSSGDAAKDNAHGAADGLFGADPVNFGTGSKFQQETDFRGGTWLTFRRFYNAHTPVPGAEMGALWRHTFDRSVEVLKSSPGASTGSIDQLVLDRPDGSSETFTHGANGWTTSLDDPDTVIEQVDGSGNTTGYSVFMVGTRQTEQYSAAGQLQSITDLSGTVTTLTYSDATTPATAAPKAGLLLTVTAPDGRTLSFVYDASARVQTITLPDGGTLVYAYDTNNNLTSVTYPDTHTKQYVYNESTLVEANLPNAMTGIIDEKGTRFETTSYNDSGQVISTQFALGADKTTLDIFNFSDNGVIPVEVTTALGFTYEPSLVNFLGGFKAAGSSSNCGQVCGQPWKSITYDTNGWPASFTDYNGNKTSTTNNAVGLETQRIEVSGTANQRTTNTTWDSVLRNPLTRSVVDANGNVISQQGWAYNTRGQVTASCQMDPSVSGAASYTCSASGAAPSGVGRSTRTYCESVDTVQCPLVGLLLSETGPRTDLTAVTQYAYYMATDESGCGTSGGACHHLGDLFRITNPLGQQRTLLTYDKVGRVTRYSDLNGVLTDVAYTPRGWISSKTIHANLDGSASSDDSTTSFTYDANGNIVQVTDPDGVTIGYGYDDAHRLTDITDALGAHVHYTLDAVGNHLKEETFNSAGTSVKSLSFTYNNLGRLIKEVDGLGNTVLNANFSDSYDSNGNLAHAADALGVQRKLAYDNLNRLVSQTDDFNGTSSATKNAELVYAYDALDRVEGVTDPDNISTTYDYDGLGNTKASHSLDSGNTNFTSDLAGNRATKTDANGVLATYQYDALDRVTSISYQDPSLNITYTYDQTPPDAQCSNVLGHVSTVSGNGTTTEFCYDVRGNVILKEEIKGSGDPFVTTTSFTPGNRRFSEHGPGSTTVLYDHDANGMVSGIRAEVAGLGTAFQSVVGGVTYLPFGPVQSYTLGNGQVVTRTYDANYRATDVVSPALNLHFALDGLGNVTALGASPGATSPLETYHYDALRHLTSLLDPTGTTIESYTYSKAGDRLSKTGSGLATGAYSYAAGTHRLTSIGSTAQAFDANGNTTGTSLAGQTFGFGFDGTNRLTVVQQNQQTTVTNSYDPLGQRSYQFSFGAGRYTSYLYDQIGHLQEEKNQNEKDFIWLNDTPVAVVTFDSGSSLDFIHADALDTPRVVTDASGAVKWQWPYQSNPFGEKQPVSTNGYVLNLRFAGQYFDAASGLVQNGYRDYNAALGRYNESDPAGLGGGLNTYAYAYSNPLSGLDPLGLWVCGDSDCGDFKAGLDELKGSLSSSKLTDEERDTLTRIVGAYGDEGKPTVVIRHHPESSSIGGWTGKDPKTKCETIQFNNKNLSQGPTADRNHRWAAAIAHEGQHLVDDIEGDNGFPISRDDAELNGYTSQAYFQQAIQFSEGTKDVWTPNGGINYDNIRQKAWFSVHNGQ